MTEKLVHIKQQQKKLKMLFTSEQFLQKIQLNLQTTFNYYNKLKKKRKLGQILNIY